MKMYFEEERCAIIDAIEELEKKLAEFTVIEIDCGSKSRLYKFVSALKLIGFLPRNRTTYIVGNTIRIAIRLTPNAKLSGAPNGASD